MAQSAYLLSSVKTDLFLHVVEGDVFDDAVFDCGGVKGAAGGVGGPDVAEGEVFESVEIALTLTIEVAVAFEVPIAENHIVDSRCRHRVALHLVEELTPCLNLKSGAHTARRAVDQYVAILLRSVRTHLEKEHVISTVKLAVFHDHVRAVPGLAAESHSGIGLAESAAVNDNIGHRAVARYGIDISALAAFEADTIVVDVHVAFADEHIVADIEVDCIRARTLRVAVGRCEDGHAEIFDALAVVEVVGPETGVDHADTPYGHILGVGNIYHARTQRLKVGAALVDLAAEPEFIIETMAVAVDRTLAADRETITLVGVDQSCEIVESLTFETGLDNLIVGYGIATLEFATFEKVQMGRGFEKQRAGQIGTFRDDNHTSAVGSRKVDHGLNTFGLNDSAVVDDTMISHHILLSELLERRLFGFVEPFGNGTAVGELLEFRVRRKPGSQQQGESQDFRFKFH